jgi:hypothetical protein
MLYIFVRDIKEVLIKSYEFSANQLFEYCKNVNKTVIAVYQTGMPISNTSLILSIELFGYLVK